MTSGFLPDGGPAACWKRCRCSRFEVFALARFSPAPATVGPPWGGAPVGTGSGLSAASVSRWRTRERNQGDARPKALGGDRPGSSKHTTKR